jgi:hypothetical protein
MLVPEVVWLSSASMRLGGGFILSILFDVAGVLCGMGLCGECVSIPGMSGMGGSLVCAWRKSAVDRRSGSKMAAGLWSMVIPSLDSCMVGNSEGERCEDARSRGSQIRRAMRGGDGGGGCIRRVTGTEGGATSSERRGVETARN